MTILATSDQTEPCIDEFEVFTAGDTPRNVALASAGGKASASSEYPDAAIHKIAHLNDGQTGNSHSWISQVPGKGTVTIEWPQAATIDRIVWSRDREGQFTDRLATEYYLEVALKPGEWHVVASSVDRLPFRADGRPGARRTRGPDLGAGCPAGRAAQAAGQPAGTAGELGTTISVYAGTFSQPGTTHVLRRGDPMQPAAEVAPVGIAAVRPPSMLPAGAPEKTGESPWHGGSATLPTPAGTGHGQSRLALPLRPGDRRHPQRLRLQRQPAVASRAPRLAGQPVCRGRMAAQAAASADRALGHLSPVEPAGCPGPVRRPPEPACSGGCPRAGSRPSRSATRSSRAAAALTRAMGGPGYNIWEKNTNYVAVYQPRDDLGPDAFRRMVYQFKPRSQQDPTFGAFDCPDAATCGPAAERVHHGTPGPQPPEQPVHHPAGVLLRRAAAEPRPAPTRPARPTAASHWPSAGLPSATERTAAVELDRLPRHAGLLPGPE